MTEISSDSFRPKGRARGIAFVVITFRLLFHGLGREGGSYVGWKGCVACHEKVAMDWQHSRHAASFVSLQKSGQENLPACVSCHVTGYGQPGGFVDKELTPQLSGVQCEACHGPGRGHEGNPKKANILEAPGVETCRQCHTKGQDPNFDYAKKVARVHSADSPSAKATAENWIRATPDHFDFGIVNEGLRRPRLSRSRMRAP